MSDPLVFVITDAGRAALPSPDNTGVTSVTVTQIGVSASAFTADAAMTALPGEIKRMATFGGSGVAADTIHVTIRDESADAYSLRSFALYLNDGTLFGLYGQAAVISEKTSASLLLLSADFKTADIDATVIEFGSTDFQNPPATETVMGVLALATNAEASAGAVPNKAITPKTLAFTLAAWLAAQFGNVWRSSNDGAGSGLDADLLDGQQGSYYADPIARMGFTPANKAGDLFTGPIRRDAGYYMHMLGADPILNFDTNDFFQYDRTNNALSLYIGGVSRFAVTTGGVNIAGNTSWHSGNDGAGSGLDAGLLGGQLPSYYAAIAARLGYTPANKAGDTFTGPVVFIDPSFYATVSGGNPALSWAANAAQFYDRTNNLYLWMIGGTTRFSVSQTGATILGNAVWRAGNDGAGSGLDADLLDGKHASSFVEVTDAASVSAKGVIEIATNAEALAGTDALRAVTPVSMSYTLDQLSYWRSGNDGAGSGLDADLLDGQQATYFLAASSYTANDVKAKLLTVDGSGSGIDADTLDGLQAAAFALLGLSNAVLPSGSNGNGTWFRIGNLIVQVGMRATVTPDTTATVTYPLPLTTNAPFFYLTGTRLSSFDIGADSFGQIIGTPGLTTMTVANQRVNSSAVIDVPWLIMAWA